MPSLSGPQERAQRRTVQQIVDPVPLLPTLDDPAPQMVEQLPDILHFLRVLSPDPEQAIEVPKILPVDVPLRNSAREPQLVEQLVEMPTIVSFSSLQRIAEQHVDIPVVGGSGTGGSLSGFHLGQNYSMTAEQIVDNPVPRRSFSGDPQSFHPKTEFVEADFKKVLRSRAPRDRNWVRSRAHGRQELSWLGACWSRGSTWGKSGPAWCVLLQVYPLTQWLVHPSVRAVHGCRLSAMVAFGRISSSTCLPCRVVRTWKTGHFNFALVSFSSFWRLGVACGVQRIGFFGRSCVHLTWFDSEYKFFESFGRIYIFPRCGELEP